ncbi:B-cell receptor CD22 isoform X1 [Fundulus heteroclitus]|uniref:B-cell receptor CD22 isoform X1 n=1 Tax=Fundulus heteroclitus TaxID=8078 RepID=UPI00165A9BB4|nr:B-cell receptor CD22 isoform X1 [Fundulus heteroclitus]
MHGDTSFLQCLQMIAVLWRGVQAASPVPSVPDRVQGVVGSCMVIPCSFTPLASHPIRRLKERVDVRLRFKGAGSVFTLRRTAFNSESKEQVSRDFLGRTLLFGQMSDGDCSVKIEQLRAGDPNMFELALKKASDTLWGTSRSVNVDIIDNPEPPVISGVLTAKEGELVSLNCSVSYHCPSRPPTLQWKWEQGTQLNSTKLGEVQTLNPGPNRWTLLASLSFIASYQVKPRLSCAVKYPEFKTLSTVKDMHVTFPPKDVKVEVQTLTVQLGGNALLLCSCKADPPVTEYHWSYTQQGRTVHLHHRSHTLRVFNVTKDMRVRCSAKNTIGRGESQPTSLNIQYKPSIHRLSSTCVVAESDVHCRCSVDSNPKAAVTWSVNGTAPPHDYNVSVTSEPDMLTASLSGYMAEPLSVICFAFNALGNDSLLLLQEEETVSVVWIILPAVVCALFVCILSLLVCCYRRRVKRQILSRHQAVYPEGLGIYQNRMPLYINCTEVTHVYTNGSYQLVYQNSTPAFVHTKQIRPIGRRGCEKRRGREFGGRDRGAGVERRPTREIIDTSSADPETAIYVEIL